MDRRSLLEARNRECKRVRTVVGGNGGLFQDVLVPVDVADVVVLVKRYDSGRWPLFVLL